VEIAEVSANFFALLGCQPAFGRTFAPEEDLPGHDSVAVIGHAFWQQFFGGDPRVLGATVYLNGTPATVIGVAPATLDFPGKTAVWIPTLFDYEHLPKSGVFYAQTIGRLKDGLAVARANAMFQADVRHSPPFGTQRPELVPLQDRLAGSIRQASFVLMGLVAFVLLIACANVAHLLLARAAERRSELMIRNALGASRARLVQQLITESTLLTLVAAGAGLAVARWASLVAAAAQPAQLAFQEYSVLDWRVVAFAAGLAALTGIGFGVLPASLMGRTQSAPDALRSRNTQPSGAGRMRAVLLAMQGALTLVLIAGAFTMGRSFLRLLGTDLGFHSGGVVTLNVSLPGTRWDSEKRTAQYYDEALARLRAIPGVESAAAVGYLPLTNYYGFMGATIELDASHKVSPTMFDYATPDYFRTMRTPILDGREFNAGDGPGSERVAIVNQEFAAKLGIGPHLVGKRVSIRFGPQRTYTIVGVTQSALIGGPGGVPSAQLFLPIRQSTADFVTFVAHVHGTAAPYLAMCRGAVQQVDRQVPIYDVKTLDERLSDMLATPRFYTTAVLFFGGFALLLAVVGIFGAASYSIAQRTHEIGVRIAVGATTGGVRGMLLWQSMLPMGCGAAAGIAGAAVLGRYLQHLIAGAESTGAWTCAAAAATLALSAALAVWTATGRIARMDPTAALRAE
jgi:putative ABC transport system permease protein